MSKSLAELRASTRVGLPERTYDLCLAQSLVAEAQSLESEKRDLLLAAETAAEKGEPRRVGQKPDPRIDEIDARLAALLDEMAEHTGELRLRGVDAGSWRRWTDAHPARESGRDEKGRPIINAVDEAVAYGLCDATALLADLGSYVVSWNGDPLGEGDWEFLANRAAPGDLNELCKIVVQLHETTGFRAPKSRPTSSATTPDENGLTSLDASA
jgi:hypothetical protein